MILYIISKNKLKIINILYMYYFPKKLEFYSNPSFYILTLKIEICYNLCFFA
jgi:hypothetical protein